MDTKEFNRLLRVSRNGGRRVIGAEASELHGLVRRMVVGFFRQRRIPHDPDRIDDVVSRLYVHLLRIKQIPERYSWNSWFWFAVKGAWAAHCKDTLDPVQEDEAPVEDRRAEGLPVPVLANAKMLEEALPDLLRRRARAVAPVGAAGDVWGWAVDMLVDHGAILNARHASVRSGLDEETCRQTVVQAVIRVREEFEGLYGHAELYSVEECASAREVAGRIF